MSREKDWDLIGCIIVNVFLVIVYLAILVLGLLAYNGTEGNVFAVLSGYNIEFIYGGNQIAPDQTALLERAFGMLMLSIMPTALMALVAMPLSYRFPAWLRIIIILGSLAGCIYLSLFYLDIINQLQFPEKDGWLPMSVFYGSPYIAYVAIAVVSFLAVLFGAFDWPVTLGRAIATAVFSIALLIISVFVYLLLILFIIFLIYAFFASRPEGGGSGRVYIFYYDP